MKTCTKCGVAKELGEFHVDRGKSQGRKNYCKACVKEIRNEKNLAAGRVVRIFHVLDVAEDGTAVCPHCHERKHLSRFKVQPRGKHGRSSICHACLYQRWQRPKAMERYEWINTYKLERGCADCGYADHPHALDFDHLPGTEKLYSIGSGWAGSAPWDKVLAEIEKCEVVCANCHRIRTHERRREVMNTKWPEV